MSQRLPRPRPHHMSLTSRSGPARRTPQTSLRRPATLSTTRPHTITTTRTRVRTRSPDHELTRLRKPLTTRFLRPILQHNPATGELVASIHPTDPSVIPRIIERAREAQREWALVPFRTRASHIRLMRDFLFDHRDEYAKLISRCTGKTIFGAMSMEILSGIASCEWYASNAARILKDEKISAPTALTANKKSYRRYEPVGVVGIISPFNYPFSIPFGEVVMGLMTGNAVILKCASATILVGQMIERIIRAGKLPDALFTHIVGSGELVSRELLLGDEEHRVDRMFFTGSVTVGKQLMRVASESLTPVVLELGGKDPMVVLEDADLERATNCACWAGFTHAGQSCAAIERIYVERSIHDRFLDLLCQKVRAMRHGPPDDTHSVDMGSLTKKSQLLHVVEQVRDAVAKGARIVAQSRFRGPRGSKESGFFHPATVLVDLTDDMSIMQEETFGPVLRVVPFDTVDEAVEMANRSRYALTASVWTRSNSRGRAVAERIDGGVVCVNDHLFTHAFSNHEWGGWKESGFGRTHGPQGLKEMCNAKIVNYDIMPSCLNRRNFYWHPYDTQSYNALSNRVLAFLGTNNYFRKGWALLRMIPFIISKVSSRWRPFDREDDEDVGEGEEEYEGESEIEDSF